MPFVRGFSEGVWPGSGRWEVGLINLREVGIAGGGRRPLKNVGKLALRLVEDGNGGKRGGGLSKMVGS